MTSIRVLHICETLPGGPASYLEEVVPYQAEKLGADNVILLVPAHHAEYISPGAGKLELYRRTGRNVLSLIRLCYAARDCIERYKPDVVHIHSSFAGGVVRLLLAFRRRRPKIVYCPHGWSFAISNAGLLRYLYAAIERRLAVETDVIVNVSAAEKMTAVKFALPGEKLVVILNGVSSTVPQSNAPVIFEAGKINLLFVGRHDPQKGLDLLISAMKQIVDYPIQLHVLGESVLSRNLRDDHIVPNITFYGWVPRDKVSAYIDAADAVIMPSRYEGFPFTAIEAMRMARPLIASSCDGLAEIVIDGETGILFPPNDSLAIVGTLKSLNHARLRSMRNPSAARFRENFTAERMNTQLLNLYERIVESDVS